MLFGVCSSSRVLTAGRDYGRGEQDASELKGGWLRFVVSNAVGLRLVIDK